MKFLARHPRLAAKCNKVFRFGKIYIAVWYDDVLQCLRFERCEAIAMHGYLPFGKKRLKYYCFKNRSNAWDAERTLLYLNALRLMPSGMTHANVMRNIDAIKELAAAKDFHGVIYHCNKLQAHASLAATAESLLSIATLFWMERDEIGGNYIQAQQDRKIKFWLNSPIHKKFFLNKAFEILQYDSKTSTEVESYLTNESAHATRLEEILNG